MGGGMRRGHAPVVGLVPAMADFLLIRTMSYKVRKDCISALASVRDS